MSGYTRYPIQAAWTGSVPPGEPPEGAIWVDTSEVPYVVKIWDRTRWRVISQIRREALRISSIPPDSPEVGDIWCDVSLPVPTLKIWDGQDWIDIRSHVDAETLNGFHASEVPLPYTIPVSGFDGYITWNWLPPVLDGGQL